MTVITDEHIAMIQAQGWFSHHEVEPQSDSILKWRRPGTSIYAMTFLIERRHLIVIGDVGDAVYEWSQQLTWPFLARLDLGYFASKCRASPYGASFRTWYPECAKRRIHEFVELADEGEIDETLRDDACDAVDTVHDWCEWLQRHGEQLFGDWSEWAGIGFDLDIQCVAHWVGLRQCLKAWVTKGGDA